MLQRVVARRLTTAGFHRGLVVCQAATGEPARPKQIPAPPRPSKPTPAKPSPATPSLAKPKAGRKSPIDSAAKHAVGTQLVGLDGQPYVVKLSSDGAQRWVVLKGTAGTAGPPAPELAPAPAANPADKPTAIVKGDPATGTLGDCPFCHRVLLTLEAKGVPYDRMLIDFDNKPDWLHEKAAGKVPVLQEGEEYLADSDAIVEALEQRYPEPSMKSNAPPEIVGGFFPAFRELLMAATSEEATPKGEALYGELKRIDDYLISKGPLFGGAKLDATDAAFAPKLYHAIVALGHFQGWSLPADLRALHRYYHTVRALPEWRRVEYTPDTVLAGWERHGAKKVV